MNFENQIDNADIMSWLYDITHRLSIGRLGVASTLGRRIFCIMLKSCEFF